MQENGNKSLLFCMILPHIDWIEHDSEKLIEYIISIKENEPTWNNSYEKEIMKRENR